MSSFSIATLGREGVITDPIKGLNYIMSCFFFSKYSQTPLYKGQVISLSNLIKQSGDDHLDISSAIEKNLTVLLERYFKSVQVTCLATREEPDIHLDLTVTVVPNEGAMKDTIDLGYALTVADSTFKTIIDRLNNEVLYQ